MNDSTWDGDSRTASPPATIGPESDSSVSAYHSRGWAARTPAAASRASWAAAACRTAAGRAVSAAARRRSATSAGMDSHRCWLSATRSMRMSSPASSVRNRDGLWSVSSPPAAVTTRRFFARVAAT